MFLEGFFLLLALPSSEVKNTCMVSLVIDGLYLNDLHSCLQIVVFKNSKHHIFQKMLF